MRAACQTLAKAKWWLQDPFSASYRAAAAAIQKHWGVKPNFVCEGGTLRVTPFLEEVTIDLGIVCVRGIIVFSFLC
jgi:protoheme ferro-lyase